VSHSALFIYSSYRTGGTAVAAAFNHDPSNLLFFDPLNAALRDWQTAQKSNSETWHSNHPVGFRYFENYLPLFDTGKMDLRPDLSEFKFRNSSIKFRTELIQYISFLTDSAFEQGKCPVFKFEQLEGHVGLLHENFPQSLHLGIVRNPKDQFQSWHEQLALGNPAFFDFARDLINRDPEFFKTELDSLKANPEEIFDVYYSGLKTLRSELDTTYNIYEESFDDLVKKLSVDFYKNKIKSAAEKYNHIPRIMSFEQRFERMKLHSLELIQQRDELIQQRDELIQQRDELIQQRDELLNSTIWKITKPLRVLIDVFKKSHKRWN
jgi:hypothetical protein